MRKIKLLLLVVFLGALLRLYHLGKTPIALEWDEVALGYDAYSILKTGRDQFGQFFPINFRSLDDYKPPLYVYAAVPGIALFGLTDFATRLPAATFGILAVILTYFLCLSLFSERKEKYLIAFLSSLFLAVSPWHLQFSRAAFETNLSVTVTLAAVLSFLRGIHKRNNKLFLASSVFFGLALFSYHSTRVVTPFLLVSLFILFGKSLPTKKIVLSFLAIYAVFVFFFIPIATSPDAQIRFLVTNDLKFSEYQEESAKAILTESQMSKDAEFVSKIFHNRRLAVYNYENTKRILQNYLKHFSPKFLFVEGDAPLHHAPGFGHMYFFDLPFLISGLAYYIFKLKKRQNAILPLWFLLAPIPASVTWQAPHGVRAEIILPTLQIFTAVGVTAFFLFLRKEARFFGYVFIAGFTGIFIFGAASYLHQYYFHTNRELSRNWMYGRKEAVLYTEEAKNKYDKVLVSLSVDMPYIFWLYYTKYPPSEYLTAGGTISGGFADERNRFDKYKFRNFRYGDGELKGNILFVGIPKEFPPDAKIVKTIYYLDGTEALKIAENKEL